MISKEHVVSESEVSMREYVDRGAVSDSKLEVADTSSILKMYTCFRVVFKNNDTFVFWEVVPYSRTYLKMN